MNSICNKKETRNLIEEIIKEYYGSSLTIAGIISNDKKEPPATNDLIKDEIKQDSLF